MDVRGVTVGMPVTDIDAARRWYEAVLQRRRPDVEPVEGVVEYKVGPIWLQLARGGTSPGGVVLRIGVDDVHAELARLRSIGVDVAEPTVIPGVIAFCNFSDPDGNLLSLYTEAQLPAGPEPDVTS